MIDFSPYVPDLETVLVDLVREIPVGRVTTFGALARALGDVTTARWIATWAKSVSAENDLPWYRILRAQGELWSDDLGIRQAELLISEGIPVLDQRVDLAAASLHVPASRDLLGPLQQLQKDWASRRQIIPLPEYPEFVGGLDVSYRGETAVAAYTLVDLASTELVWHVIRETRITFPYVSGYLAFREIPALLPVLEAADDAGKLAPVILVDGNGQLHPRRAGIATLLGVLLNRATVGVGKTLICGKLSDSITVQTGAGESLYRSEIIDQDELVGIALAASGRHKPLYVSPGNLIDLESSAEIVLRLLTNHRLPEPLHWADQLSRQSAKQ